MLVLDTCAVVFDALTPERLGREAARAIAGAADQGELAVSDITLWEVAMLVSRGRLDPGTALPDFLRQVLIRRNLQVVAISPEIAHLSVSHSGFKHFDPADRLIGATALHLGADLATCDGPLSACQGLSVIW